jgi:hypothetical protein
MSGCLYAQAGSQFCETCPMLAECQEAELQADKEDAAYWLRQKDIAKKYAEQLNRERQNMKDLLWN